MNYNEFKEFLTTFLWRDGDQVLIDNLDVLIEMAHSSLRVDLRLFDQLVSDDRILNTQDQTFPSQMRYIRQIVSDTQGEMRYVNPASLIEVRKRFPNEVKPVYSIYDELLQFSGPFADLFAAGDFYNITIFGYTDIPNFAAPGVTSSWMEQNYLDVYVYAVLQHASAFLREDERIAQWKQLYDDGINRITTNDAMFAQRGVLTTQPLPYPASPVKRRNWRHE